MYFKNNMFINFNKYCDLFIAFSEKKDGSMKIVEDPEAMKINDTNRRRFLKNINLWNGSLVSAEIVHANIISNVRKTDGGKVITDVDGLITNVKEIYLSITSADCLPIFLFEPAHGIAGMVHAGWQSLAKDILSKVMEKIIRLGGVPENILVGIGPAICQKHYEIGPEVASKFEKYPKAIKIEDGKYFLDLKKTAKLQLVDLGLKEENIEINPECTYELKKKYFSARRDKPEEVEAMIAVIGMKSN